MRNIKAKAELGKGGHRLRLGQTLVNRVFAVMFFSSSIIDRFFCLHKRMLSFYIFVYRVMKRHVLDSLFHHSVIEVNSERPYGIRKILVSANL